MDSYHKFSFQIPRYIISICAECISADEVALLKKLATSLYASGRNYSRSPGTSTSGGNSSSVSVTSNAHDPGHSRLPSQSVWFSAVIPKYEETAAGASENSEALFRTGWRRVGCSSKQGIGSDAGNAENADDVDDTIFSLMQQKFNKARNEMTDLPVEKMREYTGLVASELDKIADELPTGGFLLDVVWLMPTSTDFPILERADAFLFSVLRRLEVWHGAKITILVGGGVAAGPEDRPSLENWKTFMDTRVMNLVGTQGDIEVEGGSKVEDILSSSSSLAWQGQVKYISSRGTTFPPWPGFSLHRLNEDTNRSEPFIEILNTSQDPGQEVAGSQQSVDSLNNTTSFEFMPKHVVSDTLEFIHLANLHEIPSWFILPGKFELRLKDKEKQQRFSRSRFWLRYLTHRLPGDGQGAICQLSCVELDGPSPVAKAQGMSTEVWTTGITTNPFSITRPNVQLKGKRHTFFFLVHGDRRGRCIAKPLVSPFMLNGAAHALLARSDTEGDTTSERGMQAAREVLGSIPTINSRQLKDDEEELARMQIKALTMIIEKIRSEGLHINVTPSLIIFLFNYMRRVFYEGYNIDEDSPSSNPSTNSSPSSVHSPNSHAHSPSHNHAHSHAHSSTHSPSHSNDISHAPSHASHSRIHCSSHSPTHSRGHAPNCVPSPAKHGTTSAQATSRRAVEGLSPPSQVGNASRDHVRAVEGSRLSGQQSWKHRKAGEEGQQQEGDDGGDGMGGAGATSADIDLHDIPTEIDQSPSQWVERQALQNRESIANRLRRLKSEDMMLAGLSVPPPDSNTITLSAKEFLSHFRPNGQPKRDYLMLGPALVRHSPRTRAGVTNGQPSIDELKDKDFQTSLKLKYHGINYCHETPDSHSLDQRMVLLQKRCVRQEMSCTFTAHLRPTQTQPTLAIRTKRKLSASPNTQQKAKMRKLSTSAKKKSTSSGRHTTPRKRAASSRTITPKKARGSTTPKRVRGSTTPKRVRGSTPMTVTTPRSRRKRPRSSMSGGLTPKRLKQSTPRKSQPPEEMPTPRRSARKLARDLQATSSNTPSSTERLQSTLSAPGVPSSSSSGAVRKEARKAGGEPDKAKPSKPSSTSSSESRSEKHKRKLRSIVEETLKSKGIDSKHTCFKQCVTRLYTQTKMFVKDLKTSKGLYEEMRKIAEAHADFVINFELQRVAPKT